MIRTGALAAGLSQGLILASAYICRTRGHSACLGLLAIRSYERDCKHVEACDPRHGRHLWNPSNFAICATPHRAPILPPSTHSGEIRCGQCSSSGPLRIDYSGACKRFHITATHVVSFVVLAFGMHPHHGTSVLCRGSADLPGRCISSLIFFGMITDPRTTVRFEERPVRRSRFLVAVAEMMFRPRSECGRALLLRSP